MNYDDGRLALVQEIDVPDAIEEIEDEDLGIPLKDLDFTDLYISENGDARIRGLKDEKGPLVEVPPGAISDLDELHRRVSYIGQTEREFPVDHDGVRYRASKISAQEGGWYALRRMMFPIPRLGKLGIHRGVFQELGRLPKSPGRGLILIAGPTGNGKTTTACSLLQEYLIHYGDVAITIEDPPELRMEGKHGGYGHCWQTKVENNDFATPLRLALRQTPRYLFVGEIRDPQAASEALRAGSSGHIVLATIHGGSIQEAITSVLKLVSSNLDLELARQMLSDGLAAVVYQELKIIPITDGKSRRIPVLKTLFVAGDDGIKAKIREGKSHLLQTEIDAQQARLDRDERPVPPAKNGGTRR